MTKQEVAKEFRTFSIDYINYYLDLDFVDDVINYTFILRVIREFKSLKKIDIYKKFSISDIKYMYLSSLYAAYNKRLKDTYEFKIEEILESSKGDLYE